MKLMTSDDISDKCSWELEYSLWWPWEIFVVGAEIFVVSAEIFVVGVEIFVVGVEKFVLGAKYLL